MDRDTYTNVTTADYINQHFVSIKVDVDLAPELVAQLQRAQALINVPAGLPLISFITPEGKLYFGAGYLPAERKAGKLSFREAAEEAQNRYANKTKIDEESFQLEVVVAAEVGTTAWFAFKIGPGTFGIFDTFNDEQGRCAHVNGEVANAFFARAEELFAAAPQIQMIDIVAEKL